MEALDTTVKEILSSGTDIPVFIERSTKETKYPYFVFECRRLSEDSGIEKYVLEVNGWDQQPTSSRIKAKMNELEKAIHKLKHNDKDRTIIIYKGQKSMVDDEDKSIKRIRQQFEMHVCERRSDFYESI